MDLDDKRPQRSRALTELTSLRRALWVGCISCLLTLLCLPLDGVISETLRTGLGARGTPYRALLDASTLLFGWWTFAGTVFILVLHRSPSRILAGYAASMALGLGCVHALKFLLGRARPKIGLGTWHFEWLGGLHGGLDAMPSGHAVAAWSLALLMERWFPGSIWLLGPAAVAACISRIAVGQHFASDVVLGTGFALVAFLLTRHGLGADHFSTFQWRFSSSDSNAKRLGGLLQADHRV